MRDASEVEPNAETARALLEEGEVEPVQVVILDDVGVFVVNQRDQTANEVGFAFVALARDLEGVAGAGRPTHRDHEDAVAAGVEARRLEVEL